MSENGGLDLSKIVGLIMENPKLIEEISSLAKSGTSNKTGVEETSSPPNLAEETEKVSSLSKQPRKSGHRRELLSALKPYLSKERGKAIDSVLTIADVIGTIKES